LQVGSAGGLEACDQVLPVVVGATTRVGAIHLIDDTAISVEEAAREGNQELIRHRDGADREALPRRQADRTKPTIEPRVVELRVVRDAARLSRMTLDAILPTEQMQICLHQLAVA